MIPQQSRLVVQSPAREAEHYAVIQHAVIQYAVTQRYGDMRRYCLSAR